jgi:hypothetical protein
MLTYAMPLYEVKYHGEDEWKEISDVELMDELYKTHKKATPVIKEMITGKTVKTPHGIYRLKRRGGEQSVEESDASAA